MGLAFSGRITVKIPYGKDSVVQEKTDRQGKPYAVIEGETSYKLQNTNPAQFKTDFNDLFYFKGEAYEKLRTLSLSQNDKLEVKGFVGNDYSKETKRKYYFWDIKEFEPIERQNTAPRQPEIVEHGKDEYKLGNESDDMLPF